MDEARVWARFQVSNGWSNPSHGTDTFGSTTPVSRAISACGTLNVDAGAVARVHSSPPHTRGAPPSSDASMKHSPGPTSTAGEAEAQRTPRKMRRTRDRIGGMVMGSLGLG